MIFQQHEILLRIIFIKPRLQQGERICRNYIFKRESLLINPLCQKSLFRTQGTSVRDKENYLSE